MWKFSIWTQVIANASDLFQPPLAKITISIGKNNYLYLLGLCNILLIQT